jgi:hypothetical protein
MITDREAVFQYLHQRLGLHRSDDFRGVIFLNAEGKPGVAYGWHGFIGRTCAINIVVEDRHCLTRPVVREAFRFPFEVCGVNSVLALVDSANEKSIKLCKRSGFQTLTTIPNGGLKDNLIIFEMRKDTCPWFKEKAHA